MDNNQTIFDKIINDIENSLDGKKGPSATYVIGDNGTGKSRLLASICEYYDDDCPDNVTSVLCITIRPMTNSSMGMEKRESTLAPEMSEMRYSKVCYLVRLQNSSSRRSLKTRNNSTHYCQKYSASNSSLNSQKPKTRKHCI